MRVGHEVYFNRRISMSELIYDLPSLDYIRQLPSWVTVYLTSDNHVVLSEKQTEITPIYHVDFIPRKESDWENTWKVALDALASNVFEREFPDQTIGLIRRYWAARQEGTSLSAIDISMIQRQKELGIG